MDQLHAYWRMAYIEAPKPENGGGNPFTRIPASDDDRANHLIWRGEHTFIVMNKFPYNAGHLLVAPYREVPTLAELTATERADLMETIVLGQHILTDAIQPDGFNVGFNFGGAAGAGIPQHLHCHIVPRWNGDTNFMPVLGETKVLPESMDTMWQRLRSFAPAHA
ncbi:HIT family protein [Cerasicoccus arenae]|uniref:HIT family hydrolase n=1 Tax=Cerasicoccus arenae TaxID=424488 RepID=A0A8J3GEJ9_9BACT|nr:HIT domain-containing protein [Cerasicoccus arenae]MBK1858978.1 HIT domain-containing protein [Cerasicoccus arenae]GHC04209.1 HIT family hydrolase [Cerasicoccus arenae]